MTPNEQANYRRDTETGHLYAFTSRCRKCGGDCYPDGRKKHMIGHKQDGWICKKCAAPRA